MLMAMVSALALMLNANGYANAILSLALYRAAHLHREAWPPEGAGGQGRGVSLPGAGGPPPHRALEEGGRGPAQREVGGIPSTNTCTPVSSSACAHTRVFLAPVGMRSVRTTPFTCVP